MGIVDKIIASKALTSLVFVLLLLATEVVRYKKRLYYNSNAKNSKMKNHVLNANYNLDKKNNIDINKINKYIFISSVSAIILGGLAMALINIVIGLLTYMISATILSYLVTKKIGLMYQ